MINFRDYRLHDETKVLRSLPGNQITLLNMSSGNNDKLNDLFMNGLTVFICISFGLIIDVIMWKDSKRTENGFMVK